MTFILIQIASSKLDLQPGSLSKIVPVQSLSCIKVGTLTPLVCVKTLMCRNDGRTIWV